MTNMRIRELLIILCFTSSNRLIVRLSFKVRIEIESVNRYLRNKDSHNLRQTTSKDNKKSRRKCSSKSTETTSCVFNSKMLKSSDKLDFKRLNCKKI